MPTLNNIIGAVRELSYDRFPISLFILKQNPLGKTTINSTNFKVEEASVLLDHLLTGTLGQLTDALILNNPTIPLAFTGRFRSDEPITNLLIPISPTALNMALPLSIMGRYFNSDEGIKVFIREYFRRVYCLEFSTDLELDNYIQTLDYRAIRHLQLFTAILIVEFRRFYEYSATLFTGNMFSDGSGSLLSGSIGTTKPGDSVSVNIGSVFSLNDDLSEEGGSSSSQFAKDPSGIGADNPLDDTGFWYKLWLWLRSMLEKEYEDFSFRRDSGMWGVITLQKPIDYHTYFDSFPFTSGAKSRGIR